MTSLITLEYIQESLEAYPDQQEEWIVNHADELSLVQWNGIIKSINLDKIDTHFLERFAYQFSWDNLLNNETMSIKFFEENFDLLSSGYRNCVNMSSFSKKSSIFLAINLNVINDYDFLMHNKERILSQNKIKETYINPGCYVLSNITNNFIKTLSLKQTFDLLFCLDFNKLNECIKITPESIDMLEKHAMVDYITMTNRYAEIPKELIMDPKFGRKLNWNLIVRREKIPQTTLFKLGPELIGMDVLCKYVELGMDFIEENKSKIHWPHICQYQNLTEKFLKDNWEYVMWHIASEYQVLSEEFINENCALIDYSKIGKTAPLSDKFIEIHQMKLNWAHICQYQKLSIEMLDKFKERIRWDLVSQYQELSPSFIKKNGDKINFSLIKKNENVKTTPAQMALINKLF